VKRREFITLLGSTAAAWPTAPVIGLLINSRFTTRDWDLSLPAAEAGSNSLC
jgi:hypothetical protein